MEGFSMRKNTINSQDYQADRGRPSFDDLPQLVSDLRDEISDLKEAFTLILKHYKPHSDFMDVEEVINYIPGIKDKMGIYYLVKTKGLPAKKLGKKLYFDKSEVDEYLKNNKEK